MAPRTNFGTLQSEQVRIPFLVILVRWGPLISGKYTAFCFLILSCSLKQVSGCSLFAFKLFRLRIRFSNCDFGRLELLTIQKQKSGSGFSDSKSLFLRLNGQNWFLRKYKFFGYITMTSAKRILKIWVSNGLPKIVPKNSDFEWSMIFKENWWFWIKIWWMVQNVLHSNNRKIREIK